MIKSLLVLLIFVSYLFSQTIHFKEEKYIQALNNTFVKQGTLNFKQNQVTLEYKSSNQQLIYENDELLLKDNENIQNIDLNKHLALRVVFLLIDSIHQNDFDTLKEFFTLNTQENITYLSPKEALNTYVESIEFKKETTLKYIIITMSNGDRTTIREKHD